MRGIKIFSVILTLIIAVILAAALINNRSHESKLTYSAAQLENTLRPLYTKISDLESDRLALDRSFDDRIHGVGTTALLYTDATAAVYDIAYPEMSKYGYRGVVALSDDSFPDADGCMSVSQLSALLDAGWKWCVKFPADSETPESDVNSLLERADSVGLGTTAIIYFPDGSYSGEYDAWLAESGFQTVMHHGEEGMTVVVTEGTADGIFYQGTVNWRSTLRRHYLSAVIDSRGSIVFDMTLRTDNINADSSYHTSMLKVIEEYRSNGKLNIMTPDEMNEYRLTVESGSNGASDAWQSRKAEIDAQIAELRAEIDRICREHAEALTD